MFVQNLLKVLLETSIISKNTAICEISPNDVDSQEFVRNEGGGLYCLGAIGIWFPFWKAPPQNHYLWSNVTLLHSEISRNKIESLLGDGGFQTDNSSYQSFVSLGAGLMADLLCEVKLVASNVTYNSLRAPPATITNAGSSSGGVGIAVTGVLRLDSSTVLGNECEGNNEECVGSAIYAAGVNAAASYKASNELVRVSQITSISAINTRVLDNAHPSLFVVGNVDLEFVSGYIRARTATAASSLHVFIGSSNFSTSAPNKYFQCGAGSTPNIQRQRAIQIQSVVTAICDNEGCTQIGSLPGVQVSSLRQNSLLVQCLRCSHSTYNLQPGGNKCFPCPFGANCSSIASVVAQPGYWGWVAGSATDSKEFDSQQLVGSFARVPFGYGCMGSECTNFNSCSSGHTGVLCGSCLPQHGYRILSNTCGPNSDCHQDLLWFIPLLFLMINSLAILLLWRSTRKQILLGVWEGVFLVFVSWLQMVSLVVSSTDWTRLRSAAWFLCSLFVGSSGGMHSTIGGIQGICVVPSLSASGKIAVEAVIGVLFLIAVGFWATIWPSVRRAVLKHQDTHGHASNTTLSGGDGETGHIALFSAAHSTNSSEIRLSNVHAEGASVAFSNTRDFRAITLHRTLQIVYLQGAELCIRALASVHLSSNFGTRWFYDADTHTGTWQAIPALILTVLVALPAAFSFVAEKNLGGIGKQESQHWHVFVWYHTAPFRKQCRHWGTFMLYRRVALALLVRLIFDPAIRAVAVAGFVLVTLTLQWALRPFQNPRVQQLEGALLGLLTLIAVLQIREGSLQAASARSVDPRFDLVSLWLTFTAIMLPCAALCIALGKTWIRRRLTQLRA